MLGAGEVLTKDVSLTVHPLCIRPFEVDVVTSDPDAVLINDSGVLINGCGGDTSMFEVSLIGTGVSQSYDLEFVDVVLVMCWVTFRYRLRCRVVLLGVTAW